MKTRSKGSSSSYRINETKMTIFNDPEGEESPSFEKSVPHLAFPKKAPRGHKATNSKQVADENSINVGNIAPAAVVGSRKRSPVKELIQGAGVSIDPTCIEAEGFSLAKKSKMDISNEEKTMNGAPEGDLYDIKVLTDNELGPLVDASNEHITDHIRALLASSSLEACSWAEKYACVELVRRVILFHGELLKADAVILTASLELAVQAVESLRSCSVRNGILCLRAMACTAGVASAVLEEPGHASSLLGALLNRSSSGPRFVCDAASEAATAAASRMPPLELLAALSTSGSTMHRNAEVSSQSFLMIALAVQRQITDMPLALTGASNEAIEALLAALGRGFDAKKPAAREASKASLLALQTALGEDRFAALSSTALGPSKQAELALVALRRKQEQERGSVLGGVGTGGAPAVSLAGLELSGKGKPEIVVAVPSSSSSSSSSRVQPPSTAAGPFRLSLKEQMMMQRRALQQQKQQQPLLLVDPQKTQPSEVETVFMLAAPGSSVGPSDETRCDSIESASAHQQKETLEESNEHTSPSLHNGSFSALVSMLCAGAVVEALVSDSARVQKEAATAVITCTWAAESCTTTFLITDCISEGGGAVREHQLSSPQINTTNMRTAFLTEVCDESL